MHLRNLTLKMFLIAFLFSSTSIASASTAIDTTVTEDLPILTENDMALVLLVIMEKAQKTKETSEGEQKYSWIKGQFHAALNQADIEPARKKIIFKSIPNLVKAIEAAYFHKAPTDPTFAQIEVTVPEHITTYAELQEYVIAYELPRFNQTFRESLINQDIAPLVYALFAVANQVATLTDEEKMNFQIVLANAVIADAFDTSSSQSGDTAALTLISTDQSTLTAMVPSSAEALIRSYANEVTLAPQSSSFCSCFGE